MKQIWIEDETHMLLVKEAGRRMLIGGKRIPINKLADDLVVEAINNSAPNSAPGENPKTESNKESKPSKGAFDFSALDI